MPRVFPVVVKRTTVIISSVSNWMAQQKPATRISMVGTFLLGRPKPATLVTTRIVSATVKPTQKPATVVSTSAAGVLGKASQRPATRVTQVNTGLVKPQSRPASRVSLAPAQLLTSEKPGTNLTQIKFDLAHASHIVTAAQDAGGTGTWANPTRAQGAPNDPGDHSGDSDIGGSGVLAITGTLRGTMVGQPNRPASLTITRVDLDWYGQVTGLPVVDDLVSRLVLGYRINTSPLPQTDKDVFTIATGNSNFHSSPQTARIDNGAGVFTDVLGTAVTWPNIALIQPYFKCSIVLGLTGAHYYADAVRLRVTATETQLL